MRKGDWGFSGNLDGKFTIHSQSAQIPRKFPGRAGVVVGKLIIPQLPVALLKEGCRFLGVGSFRFVEITGGIPVIFLQKADPSPEETPVRVIPIFRRVQQLGAALRLSCRQSGLCPEA